VTVIGSGGRVRVFVQCGGPKDVVSYAFALREDDRKIWGDGSVHEISAQ